MLFAHAKMEILQLFLKDSIEELDRDFAPIVEHARGWRIHCHSWALEISAVAASSIRWLIGTAPIPRSHASKY